MPDCELLSTCPFFNDKTQEITETAEPYKEQYCRGSYGWCGRYLAYKAIEEDQQRLKCDWPRNSNPGA